MIPLFTRKQAVVEMTTKRQNEEIEFMIRKEREERGARIFNRYIFGKIMLNIFDMAYEEKSFTIIKDEWWFHIKDTWVPVKLRKMGYVVITLHDASGNRPYAHIYWSGPEMLLRFFSGQYWRFKINDFLSMISKNLLSMISKRDDDFVPMDFR